MKPFGAHEFPVAKMHFVLPNEVRIMDVLANDAPKMKLIVWNAGGGKARRRWCASAHGQCWRERGYAWRDKCYSVFRSDVRVSSRPSAPSLARAPWDNGQRRVSRELSSEMKYWVHSRFPGWP